MFESIAITVVPAPAVLELKAVRRAPARTARVMCLPEKSLLGCGGADARPVELLRRGPAARHNA